MKGRRYEGFEPEPDIYDNTPEEPAVAITAQGRQR